MKLIVLLLSFIVGHNLLHQIGAIEYAPVVRIRSGRIRGMSQEVENGRKVYFYQGIPYGRAARFSKAEYMKPWAGVYNATYFREACPQPGLEHSQFEVTPHTTSMSEDCLFLNVWRPRRNRMMNFPTRSVMVFFHGNVFERGTIFSQLYDARYLASRGDVVVVTVQYRLGPFGFLYGGTPDAPGNIGLHDQILALKWVYYNIARFGGDHNQVTIVGQSAGAMSVGSLILSPLTNRLFRRAIMQSGAPNAFYGGINKTEALERTKDMAVNLGCPTVIINETLSCLRNRSADQILNVTKDAFLKNQLFLPIYGDEVLPLKATEALKVGKFNHNVDLLFGVNQNEGSTYAAMFLPDPEMVDGRSTKEAIKWMMEFYGKNYGDEVVEQYTTNLTENASRDDFLIAIANAWGDYNIVCPTILFAEQYAKQSPRKSFFSYRMEHTKLSCSEWNGVCFQPDSIYLFAELNEKHPSPVKFTSEELQMSKDMIYAWTWFAKNGRIRNRINKSQYWTGAFERSTITSRPTTRFIALDVKNSSMVIDGFYNNTCNDFWKNKLLDDETKQLYFTKHHSVLTNLEN